MTHISPITKLIFIGTPDFAVPTLKKLSETRFRPLLVITQPDRPQGRKLHLYPPPVKIMAEKSGIEVLQPDNIKEEGVIERLSDIQPDVIITVAYGGFLTKKILRIPKHGCLNLHPSLLPKYRGATPINQALFDGERVTGVSITKMVLKMDAGPILQQRTVPVREEDNYTTLAEKLSIIGADEILEVLEKLENGQISPTFQDEDKATYCYKLKKEDLILSWQDTSQNIHNQVRGLSEEPGAITTFRDKKIKILETKMLSEEADQPAGTVSSVRKNEGIVVCCRDKQILLTKVQPAGKRVMTAYEYSIGARIDIGENFTSGFSD